MLERKRLAAADDVVARREPQRRHDLGVRHELLAALGADSTVAAFGCVAYAGQTDSAEHRDCEQRRREPDRSPVKGLEKPTFEHHYLPLSVAKIANGFERPALHKVKLWSSPSLRSTGPRPAPQSSSWLPLPSPLSPPDVIWPRASPAAWATVWTL